MPLVPANSFTPVEGINPVLDVAGSSYLLLTQRLTAIKASEMRGRVAYLHGAEDMAVKALDRLLTTT